VTDQQALLAAIISQPDDDQLRLIYADYLDENSQGDLAMFIRLDIERSRHGEHCQEQDPGYRHIRCKTWGKPCDWCAADKVFGEYIYPSREFFDCASAPIFYARAKSNMTGTSRACFAWRGFIETVRCTSAQWRDYLAKHFYWQPEIRGFGGTVNIRNQVPQLTAQPIRFVSLIDDPAGCGGHHWLEQATCGTLMTELHLVNDSWPGITFLRPVPQVEPEDVQYTRPIESVVSSIVSRLRNYFYSRLRNRPEEALEPSTVISTAFGDAIEHERRASRADMNARIRRIEQAWNDFNLRE
jgi:uncharacterized protein (TIGR02996 family)